MDYSEDFFGPSGLLATLAGYEYRPQQQEMANKIAEVLRAGHVALIEAGTGTGKSLAYLYPAVCHAKQTKEKIVISTNTINLQEQLLHNDLPVLHSLGIQFTAVVVKGWTNYPCWLRVQEMAENPLESDTRMFNEMLAKLENGQTITRSDMSIGDGRLWEDIQAESDLCLRGRCPFFKDCPVFVCRRQAEQAEIIIVNHHLLLADIHVREETGWEETAVLPVYQHVIVDEAHHLQDVATQYFGTRLSQVRIRRLLSAFYRPWSRESRGLLPSLRQRLEKFSSEENGQELITQIDWRLMPQIRDIDQATNAFAMALERYLIEQNQVGGSIRLMHGRGICDSQVMDSYDLLHRLWLEWEGQLRLFLGGLEQLEEETGAPIGPFMGMRPLVDRVESVRADLQFLMDVDNKGYVYWLGLLPRQKGVVLEAAPIDVGTDLREKMLFPLASAIFTSATLAINNKFDYYRECIGLNTSEDWQLETKIYASPFQYGQQIYLAVPLDFPKPNERGFVPYLTKSLTQLIPLMQGRTFVLFTSYAMLKQVVAGLRLDGFDDHFNLLVQGELSRFSMIKQFKSQPRSVLFGTDSFWEGVDVAGDALSSVIITKLPFRVPTDPIVAARAEQIQAAGGNPFQQYFLPQAVIKFRQGCGRLIRTSRDRGLILVCDKRVVEQAYGQYFLGSLPACQLHTDHLQILQQEVQAWLLSSQH